ncbi:Uncharacterised protein [Mycobacteroides abscessus subsp. abscessus]|nr:Uncharacterised protein [Mycobacteroides abscessus subsp. abscessus]
MIVSYIGIPAERAMRPGADGRLGGEIHQLPRSNKTPLQGAQIPHRETIDAGSPRD